MRQNRCWASPHSDTRPRPSILLPLRVCSPGSSPSVLWEVSPPRPGFLGGRGAGQAPVGLLPDHLEHADVQGPVEQVGAGQLVNPELGGRDCLALRDLGQVEAELLPVGLLVAQGAVTLHCKTEWGRRSLTLWAEPGGAGGQGTWVGTAPSSAKGLAPRLCLLRAERARRGRVLRCPAQGPAHRGAGKSSLRFWPPSPKPSLPHPSPAGSGTQG